MAIDSLGFRANPLWVQSPHGQILSELSAQLRGIWMPAHSVRSREEPGVIFHYTTTDGLIGILESNELWATDLNYMKDVSELAYARDLISEHLKARLMRSDTEPVLVTFYQRVLRMIGPPGYRRFYGACFCEDGDLLSQWRAYGGRGGGYAIGLHADEIGLGSQVPLCVRKAIYDPGLQRTLVEATLDRTETVLVQFAQGKPPDVVDSIVPIICHFLEDHLSEYTFTFKNEAFREEKEWRVVLGVLPWEQDQYRGVAHFRNSGGTLLPYLALNVGPAVGVNMGRLPISRIVFGPTTDRGLTDAALGDLLAKHRLVHVQVVASKIPLRG